MTKVHFAANVWKKDVPRRNLGASGGKAEGISDWQSDFPRYLASRPLVKATFVILLVICRSVCRDMYVKSSAKDRPVVQ